MLEINRKLSHLGRIYEPEGSIINIEQLKTKDEFDELNEKLEDPSEKANLVIKWVFGVLSQYYDVVYPMLNGYEERFLHMSRVTSKEILY